MHPDIVDDRLDIMVDVHLDFLGAQELRLESEQERFPGQFLIPAAADWPVSKGTRPGRAHTPPHRTDRRRCAGSADGLLTAVNISAFSCPRLAIFAIRSAPSSAPPADSIPVRCSSLVSSRMSCAHRAPALSWIRPTTSTVAS